MITMLEKGTNFTINVMTLNRPPAAAVGAQIPLDFLPSDRRVCKLDAPVANASGTPISAVGSGNHSEAKRTFVWLPYVPGKITYVPLGQLAIVTGYMSGCWLVVFRLNNQTCFGHIGTATTANDPQSLAVKNAWKIAVGRGMVTPMQAFNPIKCVQPKEKTFGALSKDAEPYAVSCSWEGSFLKVFQKSECTAVTAPQF